MRELYTKEFKLYPIEYYEAALKNGNLLVNLKPVESLDVRVHENDLISTKWVKNLNPYHSSCTTIILSKHFEDEFFYLWLKLFILNQPACYESVISLLFSIILPSLYRLHRHEGPVADLPVGIVRDDDDFLVVNKPSSIPIHPCGRYRNNSLVFILAKVRTCTIFLIRSRTCYLNYLNVYS